MELNSRKEIFGLLDSRFRGNDVASLLSGKTYSSQRSRPILRVLLPQLPLQIGNVPPKLFAIKVLTVFHVVVESVNRL